MRIADRGSRLALLLILIAAAFKTVGAGASYQTDDPVPVDLHHYEFYIFGGVDGTPVEMDSTGPAFEFNWGAINRVQLHAILPWGGVFPSNNPVYLPGGTGTSAFGLTDMELGVKIAIIKETKHVPQIGTFTMFEMPTGSYNSGLGVGKVWYKLPVWFQKNSGKWLLTAAAATRWFRRRTIAIFLIPDGWSNGSSMRGWNWAQKFLRMDAKDLRQRRRNARQ